MLSIQILKKHIQYPKLLALLTTMLLSYLLFKFNFFSETVLVLNSRGYVSVFIAGLLFSYGFTAPFALGLFATVANDVNILFASFLGALGAVASDILIFQFIRTSFIDEIEKLKMTALFQRIHIAFHNHVSDKVKRYVLLTCAGFLIASPFPDEFGVSLISGFTKISGMSFAIIAFGCDFLGILIIFALAGAS